MSIKKKLFIIFLLSIFGISTCDEAGFSQTSMDTTTEVKPLYDGSNKSLLALLKWYDIPYPEMFVQVAILESGHDHTSLVAMNAQNLFGFGYVHGDVRTTTCIGSYYGHAIYSNIDSCIIDLKHWVDFNPPRPDEDPYQFLKRRDYNPYNFYFARLNSITYEQITSEESAFNE